MACERASTRRVLLAGIGGALLPVPPGAAKQASAGRVAEARGLVEGELQATRRQLAPPDSVFVGEFVSTGADARAALLLGGHTLLRLGASARLRIDRFMARAGGAFTLDAGALLLDKDPATKHAPVSIRGAFGLIAVRGTRLFVGPSQGVTGIYVLRGPIDVTAAGQRVTLHAGEGTNIAGPGQPPAPVVQWGQARINEALASVD